MEHFFQGGEMKVALAAGVVLRPDDFGGIAYAPTRDDFFCLDSDSFTFLRKFSRSPITVPIDAERACVQLAELELLATDPVTPPRAYSGPSFIGRFQEIATLSRPLVLNCFATSHCPLRCVYCHADDLMQPNHRANEGGADDHNLQNVLTTARLMDSITAVITGGDPLTRPERATILLEGLAGHKALVLDTSGVAPRPVIDTMLPLLKKLGIHLRLSLDSYDPRVHDKVRPANTHVVGRVSSHHTALQTLKDSLSVGLPLTVQTVVSNRMDTRKALFGLRDYLLQLGVRHWVLHLAVEAGAARRIQATSRRGILPRDDARADIWSLVRKTIEDRLPIDIRVTDNHNTPNSVLLIGSTGTLYTEGLAHRGKVALFDPLGGRPDRINQLFYYIDRFGHARRYLNWNPGMYERDNLEDLCIRLELPSASDGPLPSVIEIERKFEVSDRAALEVSLGVKGFQQTGDSLVDDRYYDNGERTLQRTDFVVRLRVQDGRCYLAQKGPRYRHPSGEYDRVEIELAVSSLEEAEVALAARGLSVSWRLCRRRTTFSHPFSRMLSVVIDELPEVGTYSEIEGSSSAEVNETLASLRGIGRPEARNYRELVVSIARSRGASDDDIVGLGESGILLRRSSP
jgi:predicted adenylyl cyclase CyaB